MSLPQHEGHVVKVGQRREPVRGVSATSSVAKAVAYAVAHSAGAGSPRPPRDGARKCSGSLPLHNGGQRESYTIYHVLITLPMGTHQSTD
jgi:hypothetical protein